MFLSLTAEQATRAKKARHRFLTSRQVSQSLQQYRLTT